MKKRTTGSWYRLINCIYLFKIKYIDTIADRYRIELFINPILKR